MKAKALTITTQGNPLLGGETVQMNFDSGGSGGETDGTDIDEIREYMEDMAMKKAKKAIKDREIGKWRGSLRNRRNDMDKITSFNNFIMKHGVELRGNKLRTIQ